MITHPTPQKQAERCHAVRASGQGQGAQDILKSEPGDLDESEFAIWRGMAAGTQAQGVVLTSEASRESLFDLLGI